MVAESSERRDGFAEVNGARLYYVVEGAGPAVVLLHAGVSDHQMWDAVVPAFRDRYQVIRYDQRGFGQSSIPSGPFSLHDDLYGLLGHLGVRAATVVGVSIGARVALDFTLTHPALVTALVPVAAGLGGRTPTAADKAVYAPMEAAYEAKDLERILELETELWLVGPGRKPGLAVAPDLRARFQAIERANLAREMAGEGAESQPVPLDPPARDRLHEIQVPTLVIVGDADVADCVTDAGRIAAGIAGARAVVLPNVAHMVPMEAPAEFNRLLAEFLATV
ncbi:MAG: alpha/beta fold hydrolase [Chloroflexota bacterium]|nr:alpha/beta fold hydrolase [Chloroflexota bacterium]